MLPIFKSLCLDIRLKLANYSNFHNNLGKCRIPTVVNRSYGKKIQNNKPDPQTTFTVLNKEEGAPLMIDAYNQIGFRLNNGVKVIGPMVIFPKTVLSWSNVEDVKDITKESLSLFFVLEPKIDVLIIGFGNQGDCISKEDYTRIKKLNSKGTVFEVLTSDKACALFNFLNNEKRIVAAAIIPPTKVTLVDEDTKKNQERQKLLYDDNNERNIPNNNNDKTKSNTVNIESKEKILPDNQNNKNKMT